MSRTTGITDKQQAFANCYTDTTSDTFNNATKSAAASNNGKTLKSQRSRGTQLLKHPKVREAIRIINEKTKANNSLTIEYLKKRYLDLAERCVIAKDRTNEKGAYDSMTRMLGGFTDNLNQKTEDITPLSEAESEALEQASREMNLKLSKDIA